MSQASNEIIQFPQQRQMNDWDEPEKIALIRKQIAPDLTDGEFGLFLETARARGLNPITRQIHVIVHNKNNPQKRRMTVITGIDGFSTIASRTKEFAGADRPVFEGSTPAGYPHVCVMTIHRLVNGVRCPFTVEAYWDEYVELDYNGAIGTMWKKMPNTMLAKCALAKALRLAFPEDLGGLYTSDEMAQSNNPPTIKDVTPAPQIAPEAIAEAVPTGVSYVMENPRPVFVPATEAPISAPIPPEQKAATEIMWGTGKKLDPESAKFFINKWGSPYAAVFCGDANTNDPERVKALAWFHAKLKDEYHIDHKACLKILKVKSLKDECPDWPLGFVLEQVGLLKD